MRLLHGLAKIHVTFDDPNLVSRAGLVPVMALAERAGLADLAGEHVRIAHRCGVNPQVKVPCVVAGMIGGADSIEDLDLLRDGELHHLHFEDVPAEPIRELQAQPNRQFPGEGIVPLRRIVEVLKRKKYAGAASLEMFNPMIQAMDPYEVAKKARATIEPLIA